MSKDEPVSLDQMVKQLAEGLKNSQWKQSILTYAPHEKQLVFHQAPNRGRMFIGGNRSGKTVAGATEAIWWLTHKHPYMRTPEWPIEGRIGSVDFTSGVEAITKPEVRKWLPPSELINGSWEDSYDRVSRTLTLANGSFVEFKSYDQDLDKWAGTARDFTWFDEEPPQAHWEEGVTRLTSKNGKWWLTMTPVERATWTLDELYQPGLDGIKDIFIIEVNVNENTHLDQQVVDEIFGLFPEEEQVIRRQGKYLQNSNLVFPMFDHARHVIDKLPFDPRNPRYRIMASVDLGLNAPTAWLWHAVTPEGDVYTFHEIVKSNVTIPDYAKLVHTWERKYGIKPTIRIADPAAAQRSRQTGLSDAVAYSQAGLPLALGNNNVEAGINKMRDYLTAGRWFITQNCAITIKEMKKYRFEEWDSRKARDKNNPKEKPLKKNDHAMDSARYLFSKLPELKQMTDSTDLEKVKRVNAALNLNLKGKAGVPLLDNRFDPSFNKQEERNLYMTEDGFGYW